MSYRFVGFFFFSSRRRHTRLQGDWSSDVCSSDLPPPPVAAAPARDVAPAAVRLSDDDGAADTATLSRAEPVLTETMAELYLRQGRSEERRVGKECRSRWSPDH